MGEHLAGEYLIDLGWSVLQRNWRTKYGELDLIAVDGDTLVIVEVKTRASAFYGMSPAHAVTPDKLSRMRRLAGQWLAGQSTYWASIRFDVIAVQLDSSEPEDLDRAAIEHLRGVFE